MVSPHDLTINDLIQGDSEYVFEEEVEILDATTTTNNQSDMLINETDSISTFRTQANHSDDLSSIQQGSANPSAYSQETQSSLYQEFLKWKEMTIQERNTGTSNTAINANATAAASQSF